MGHSHSHPQSTVATDVTSASPLSHEDAKIAFEKVAESLHLRLSTEEAASLKNRLGQMDVPSVIKTSNQLCDFLNQLKFFETEFFRNIVKTGVTLADTGGQLLHEIATNDEMKKVTSQLLFEEFDTDHNNSIDPNELMKGLLIYAVKSTDEMIKMRFVAFDEDNSGYLIKEEIHHLLNVFAIQSIKMLKITILVATEYAMEECRDSPETRKKYRAKIRPILEEFEREALKSMTKHMNQIQTRWTEITDTNHDGKISLDEFKQAFDEANTQQMTDFIGSFFQKPLKKYLFKAMMSFN